jgi:hypothetical protein
MARSQRFPRSHFEISLLQDCVARRVGSASVRPQQFHQKAGTPDFDGKAKVVTAGDGNLVRADLTRARSRLSPLAPAIMDSAAPARIAREPTIQTAIVPVDRPCIL